MFGNVYGGPRGTEVSTATQKKNNASGVTLVIGSVVQMDFAGQTGNSAAQFDKLIKPATAGIASGVLGVCADDSNSVADGSDGNFIFGEGVKVKVKVNASGVNIAKKDALKAGNGVDYAVKATTGTDRWHFIALEAATTDGAIINAVLYSSGRF